MQLLLLLSQMFIILAGIAGTLFVLAYAVIARHSWWRHSTGRGLFVSSLALALVLDLTLVFQAFEVDPFVATFMSTIVLGLVTVGTFLMCGALIEGWLRGRKAKQPTDVR